MSNTILSMRWEIGSVGDHLFFVHTMKTLVAPIDLCGLIETSAGKYRRKSSDLPVLREGVCVQRSVHRCYKLVLRAVLLGAVYSVLTSTVVAQEPIGKPGEPQKLTAPAKEELSPAPAIRLVKRAFQEHGISMPDEAREVVFPKGVPVTVLEEKPADAHIALPGKRFPVESLHEELDAVSTKAEAGLYSEAVVIEEQARQAQPLKEGENLLSVASGTPSSEEKTNSPKA